MIWAPVYIGSHVLPRVWFPGLFSAVVDGELPVQNAQKARHVVQF